MEREALGMIYNVTKYCHFLLGQKFSFHVDHSTLLYLVSKSSLTGKLARWTLLLQELEFEIYHRPEVQHVLVDYLSWLESGEVGNGVQDKLLDVQLIRVTVKNTVDRTVAEEKGLTNMHHFLSIGLSQTKING